MSAWQRLSAIKVQNRIECCPRIEGLCNENLEQGTSHSFMLKDYLCQERSRNNLNRFLCKIKSIRSDIRYRDKSAQVQAFKHI